MTDTTSIITATLMFADLDDAELHELESAASELTLRRGDVLFAEGADPDALYIVTRGRIAIANKSIDGRESVVALLEPGDLFGEMGLFVDGGRSAEARALEQSAAMCIPYEPVRILYEGRPRYRAPSVFQAEGLLRSQGDQADVQHLPCEFAGHHD